MGSMCPSRRQLSGHHRSAMVWARCTSGAGLDRRGAASLLSRRKALVRMGTLTTYGVALAAMPRRQRLVQIGAVV